MSFDQIIFVLSMMATVAFAVTGVLVVSERRIDFFLAVVLGIITAIGGGPMRGYRMVNSLLMVRRTADFNPCVSR